MIWSYAPYTELFILKISGKVRIQAIRAYSPAAEMPGFLVMNSYKYFSGLDFSEMVSGFGFLADTSIPFFSCMNICFVIVT